MNSNSVSAPQTEAFSKNHHVQARTWLRGEMASAQTEAGRPLVGKQQEELLHRGEVRLREL